MPKPARVDIGSCPCPTQDCGRTAAVRRTGATKAHPTGRLFLNCPRCGPNLARGEWLQEWILEKGTIYGPEGAPGPAPEPAPAPEPGPEPAPSHRSPYGGYGAPYE